MSNYTTGTFAKMAKVTERTIRYYDKVGLLKPSFVMENGYRQYSDHDFIKLQRILFLKQLGFSIEEIYPLIDNEANLLDSIKLQISLIDKQINHYTSIKDSLKTTSRLIEKESLGSENILELLRLISLENDIVEQYKNENNLRIRIHLHKLFSTNKKEWYTWLFEQMHPNLFYKILEVGCGDGTLWEQANFDLRNREIYLTDNSEGMIESVRRKYGDDFNCLVADCVKLPFKNDNFECVIANHVLFYASDVVKGIKEMHRVLKFGGFFYCSTYGVHHMKELNELVREFDERIVLSEQNLAEKFGLENGESLLKENFKEVELLKYEDALHIDQIQPLVDYIGSCYGNQNEIINKRLDDFKKFIENKLKEKKYIYITKDVGLFICKK